MKFLIQYNLMADVQLERVRKAVAPFPHAFVGLIPFSRVFTGEVDVRDTSHIPYGSTLMSTLGLEYGWRGLHFNLDTFNYRAALEHRDDMLNSNVMKISDAIAYLGDIATTDPEREMFMRPSHDLKQFSGQVIGAREACDWLQDAMQCESSGSYRLEVDTEIVVCEPQNILAEWRWFIVGGKIIDGSMYRRQRQMYQRAETDTRVIEEAQKLAHVWLPDTCCVMDTALVGDSVKVIEFNCINSSGFYQNDPTRIFNALWDHHNRE